MHSITLNLTGFVIAELSNKLACSHPDFPPQSVVEAILSQVLTENCLELEFDDKRVAAIREAILVSYVFSGSYKDILEACWSLPSNHPVWDDVQIAPTAKKILEKNRYIVYSNTVFHFHYVFASDMYARIAQSLGSWSDINATF